MLFMINQFPRKSRHVSRLSYKDVPIFLELFDEREFLFGIQIVAVSLLAVSQLSLSRWPASTLGTLRAPLVCQLSRNSPYRSQKPT
jgi:hypothetical protein